MRYRMGVANYDDLLDRILRGVSDANINFNQLRNLLKQLGFRERIRGDHHIFSKANVVEIVNIQPKSGKAKPYQVKQVRGLLVKYRLAGEHNEK
jgi:predicted RNA binding protein YcfA (HicA-like mRNA interferase family)